MKSKNCKYCGGPIEIRNPTGNCDHLYYPENCNKAMKLNKKPITLTTKNVFKVFNEAKKALKENDKKEPIIYFPKSVIFPYSDDIEIEPIKSKNKGLSKCCKGPVTVGGEGMTHYYVCKGCKKPTDIWYDDLPDLSQCPYCFCATKTIKGKCGKCKEQKEICENRNCHCGAPKKHDESKKKDIKEEIKEYNAKLSKQLEEYNTKLRKQLEQNNAEWRKRIEEATNEDVDIDYEDIPGWNAAMSHVRNKLLNP